MTIEKLDASTPDLTRQNIERMLELFPECRTEGSREDAPMVDFDLLRQALSDYLVEGPAERYRLDWPGKRQALLTANTPIDKTLRPRRKESVDFDTTSNLFIEGDNLDALKLLQETYLGKVKMIYIDPPYNTGNDFVYRDNFEQSRYEYEEGSGQRDIEGGRLVANPESNGRFHSDWMSMMLPRLKLARNLLADDGIIFITADDHEISNLSLICQQVFGEANFVAMIAWQKKYSVSNNFKGVASVRDHIVAFAKSEKFDVGLLPRTAESAARYQNPDNDPRGPWKAVDYWNMASAEQRPNCVYPIVNPNTGEEILPEKKSWKFERATHQKHVDDDRIWWGKSGTNTVPALKLFLSEVKDGMIPHNWWPHQEVGHTDASKKHLDKLFDGAAPFDTPKPIGVIERMLQIANLADGDRVVDFFAGSGSTAEAVFKYCQDTKTRISFVMCQIDETCAERSDAAKLGYQTISEICRERITRAGKKYATETNGSKDELDTGFRAFRIDSGNFVDTSVTSKEATQSALAGMVSHIKDDRSEEDLLFGALLRWGVDITLPIEQRELVGRTVWLVDAPEDGSGKGAALIACFAKPGSSGKGGIDTELADAMAELAPLRVLFRDDGFADDATKENVHSRFQQRAPDTQVRVL